MTFDEEVLKVISNIDESIDSKRMYRCLSAAIEANTFKHIMKDAGYDTKFINEYTDPYELYSRYVCEVTDLDDESKKTYVAFGYHYSSYSGLHIEDFYTVLPTKVMVTKYVRKE